MKMNVKAIEITFENLDFIVIPEKYILDFHFHKIPVLPADTTSGEPITAFEEYEVECILAPEADIETDAFDGDVSCVGANRVKLCERLQQNDITQIRMLYSDETNMDIHPVWNDAYLDHNEFQTTKRMEDGRILVSVCRQEYKILQIINESSIPPTIYSEGEDDINSCICIARQGSKIGMVTGNGKVLLPFEYDNITMAGFHLYLLIQNGKMGLLHVTRPVEEPSQPFEIINIIPCEYNLVTCPRHGQSFAYLRKDTLTGSLFYVYFVKTKRMRGPFWKLEYIDEDYVAVKDLADKSTLRCFDRNGTLLFESKAENDVAILLCSAFETKAGTVFVQINTDDTVDLILVERVRKEQYKDRSDDNNLYYKCTGVVHRYHYDTWIRPILANEHIHSYDRDAALGFIVEKDGKQIVLNYECRNITKKGIEEISIVTYLKGLTDQQYKTYLALQDQAIEVFLS